jgi:hypothetical protein
MKIRGAGRIAAACLAVGVAGAVPAAVADGKSKDWSLDISAGVKFDDRVTIDEADASAASDVAAVIELDGAYKLVNENDTRVEVGYEFYQSLYSDLSDFNWQEHNPSISAWTKAFGGVKLGISYDYLHGILGGSFYYGQHTIAPSLSAYLSDDIMVTLSYRYYDKDYTSLEDARDATGHQPNADAYFYFSENKRGYLSFGAGYTNEDTTGPEYDYSGFVGRAAIQVPIEPFGMPGRLRLSYSYQMRDYDSPESLFPVLPPVPGDPTREDDRQTLRLLADAEIADNLKLYADYRFQDRGSNLPSADYNKNVASLGLEYSF